MKILFLKKLVYLNNQLNKQKFYLILSLIFVYKKMKKIKMKMKCKEIITSNDIKDILWE